jgi:hypothetical protein
MAWNWRTILERAALATLLTTSAVIGAGCGDEEQGGDALTGHDFVSDRPGGNNYSSGAGEDAGGDTSSGTSGAGGSGGNVAPDDPEREIIEADIIQVQDNRLFALSQYGGLSIIDISQPDNLALEGRYTVKGTPFEMYLQDNLVFAMFTDWGEYVWDEGYDSYQWVSTSRIEVIDVSNPAAPTQLGEFDLPGYISDSRIVGDVLYAVTFEDGYCYGCGQSPNTTITALNIGTPGAIGIVDQLTYTNPDPYSYGWWRRSIHVTEERIYVGGVEWDGQGAGHSTIQVVDISAPNGILVEGRDGRGRGADREPLADGRARRRVARHQPARHVGDGRAAGGADLHRAELGRRAAPGHDVPHAAHARASAQRALRRPQGLRDHRGPGGPAVHHRPRRPCVAPAARHARDARLGLSHGAAR